MQKNIFLGLLVLLAVPLWGQGTSESHDHFHDYLKVSPIQFASSYFELSYEKTIGQNKSFSISPMVMLKKDNFEEFKGLQLEMQYRVYLRQLNHTEQGTWIFSDIDLYTGLYANGLSYTEDFFRSVWDPERMVNVEDTFTKDVTAAETGVFVGLQLSMSEKVVLDFTVGGGVRYSEVDDEFEEAYPDLNYDSYDVFDIEYYGVKPKLNLQIGITL